MSNQALARVILALVALMLLSNACFVVDQREHVRKFRFREIQETEYGPGLYLKWPMMESVVRFDSRVLSFDSSKQNFLTAEKKNVEVEYFVKWRIDDTAAFYRATRGDKQTAADRLSAIVNRVLRDRFGSLTIQEALAGKRDQITQDFNLAGALASVAAPVAAAAPAPEPAAAAAKPAVVAGKDADEVSELGILGVKLIDVRIKSINLPHEVSDSVYERMRAERTRAAAEFRARGAKEAETIRAGADQKAQITIAEAYRDSEKLRGEGDARAAEIYANAYGKDPEFYNFYRTLNVYKDVFQDQSNVLVLEPKGEFFRYFKGDSGSR